MKVGYIRVSTNSQNMDRQNTLMEEKGIERIFDDTSSGKNADRQGLKDMLEFVRNNDEVHIESLSRLGRSLRDLLNIVSTLNDKGVHLISHKESIDSSTSSGRLQMGILMVLCEYEREIMLERQAEGIAEAKKAGKYKGRKRIDVSATFEKVYNDVKNGLITTKRACELLGVSYQTYKRRVKEYEGRYLS